MFCPKPERKGPPFPWCEDCPEHCSLDCVPDACRAEVISIGGSTTSSGVLARLGIFAGAILLVHRTAPMGGPVLVEAQGSTVAVGRGLARQVVVRLLA